MENQVLTYEEVAAYQAQYGVATYAANSGAYHTGGIYVEWTTTGGFTNLGWQTDNASSPVYNMTEEQIQEEIRNNGNLNRIFEAWTKNKDYKERYEWILDFVSANCHYEIR